MKLQTIHIFQTKCYLDLFLIHDSNYTPLYVGNEKYAQCKQVGSKLAEYLGGWTKIKPVCYLVYHS